MANYLYNGMELPALPKTNHPIAVMNTALYGMLKKATLYLFSELEYTSIESSGDRGLLLTESNHVRFSATATDTEWTAIDASAGSLNIKNIGWTSHDILNSDGTLYLAASEPVPVHVTERSLYSYNGTTFPNINTVWTNKTTYPYAVLFDYGTLLLLTKRPYYNSVKGSYKWPSESFTSSSFRHIGNGWMFTSTNIDVSLPETINMGTPLWLNVDWLTETGEVYQATTEPVYIGEADPVPEAESYYLYSSYFSSTANVKHEIPALPYWDKEKYPYYLIAESNVFKKSYNEKFYEYVLAISTEPFFEKSKYYPVTEVTRNQILVPSQNTEVKLCWYRYDYPGFVWSPFILKEPVIEDGTWEYTVDFSASDVILSNVNILDSNGYIWAGLNQLIPVPTKLENFICGYIAGLSGGHTEFRDNTWPIRFNASVISHNRVKAGDAIKISDEQLSVDELNSLVVAVINSDGIYYNCTLAGDAYDAQNFGACIATYSSGERPGYRVYLLSYYETIVDGDEVAPETGLYIHYHGPEKNVAVTLQKSDIYLNS